MNSSSHTNSSSSLGSSLPPRGNRWLPRAASVIFILAIMSFATSYLLTGAGFPKILLTEIAAQTNARVAVDAHDEFSGAGVEVLEFRGASTDVEVARSADSDIHVQLKGSLHLEVAPAGGSPSAASEPWAIEHHGANVEVKIHDDFGSSIGSGSNVDLQGTKLTAQVPPSFRGRLLIHTVSGEISITGLNLAALEVKTVSGNQRLRDVKIQELQLRSVSGDVQAGGEVQHLDVQATSGDVQFNLLGELQGLVANTISGEVTIHLAKRPPLKLDLSSVSGGITFPESWRADSDRKWPGELKVRTISGDIKLESP